MKNSRLFLAEDHPLYRSCLLGALKEAGYTNVREFNDANSLMKGLQEEMPAIIMMDTQMPPGPLGYEACREIRKRYNGVTIIGMSVNQHYAQDWIDAGADNFICKDIALTTQGGIEAAIEKALGKK
jgi:DNA-binding NarL/FixJ family response regulator